MSHKSHTKPQEPQATGAISSHRSHTRPKGQGQGQGQGQASPGPRAGAWLGSAGPAGRPAGPGKWGPKWVPSGAQN